MSRIEWNVSLINGLGESKEGADFGEDDFLTGFGEWVVSEEFGFGFGERFLRL